MRRLGVDPINLTEQLKARNPSAPGGTLELATRLDSDRTTLTRNLDLMRKAGWIIIGSGKDRRVRKVTLTKEGRDRFQSAEPHWREAQKEAIIKFGEDNWQSLLGLLQTMAQTVRPS